jgi:hypothetical protein
MFGAVLEGFAPLSDGAKTLSGVYRVCGEHEDLPRFQGAETRNGAAHMYRYRAPSASDARSARLDSWRVANFAWREFTPESTTYAACVNSLPGGAVPVHGLADVKWEISPQVMGRQPSMGQGWLTDQPLVLTALVSSSSTHPPPRPPSPVLPCTSACRAGLRPT